MTTYADLLLDIQRWTEDDSTEMSTSLPRIIAYAEDRIMADLPLLPVFRTTKTGSLLASTDTITLTEELKAIRTLSITVSGVKIPLEQRSDAFVEDYAPDTSVTGQPKYYALQSASESGSVVLFGPNPDSNYAYTLRWRGMHERLSTSNQNTGLGDDYPDLLFKAALVEAAIFLEKEEDTMGVVAADYKDRKDTLALENQSSYIEEGTIGA